MCDDDERDREIAGEVENQSVEFCRGNRVESRRGLIQKENVRVKRHGTRDGRTFLHAAAEFGGHIIQERFQPYQFEFHASDQIHGIRRKGRVFFQGQPDIFQQGHGTEQRTHLIRDPNALENTGALISLGRHDVLPADEDMSGRGLVEADHVLQQGAFSTAGSTEDGKDFATIDLKRNVVDHH